MRPAEQRWRWPVSFWCNYSLAIAAGSLLPGMAISASSASMGEPFLDWPAYLSSWVIFGVIFSFFPYPFGLVPAILPWFLPRPSSRAALAASMSQVWVASPLLLIWCVASLMDACYHPGFLGPRSTGPPPSSWRPLLDSLSSDIVLYTLIVAGVTVVALRYRPELDRWRRYFGGFCERCGYNLTGLPSDICPECGNEHAKRDGQRAL